MLKLLLHRPKKIACKTYKRLILPDFVPKRRASLLLSGPLALHFERVSINTSALKRPVRLLHLSDIHLDWNTHHWLLECVPLIHQLVAQENIEGIMLTGDHISHDSHYIQALQAWCESLPKLAANFAIMGNHDYYERTKGRAVSEALQAGGFNVLHNTCEPTSFDAENRIQFHGLDDYEKARPNPSALIDFARSTPDEAHLLLVHNPAQFVEAYDWHVFDAAFAGHTHGGQFKCPERLARIITEAPYVRDWYEINGHCQLFVHPATGTASIPSPLWDFRLKRRPPISLPRWGMMPALVIHEIVPARKF